MKGEFEHTHCDLSFCGRATFFPVQRAMHAKFSRASPRVATPDKKVTWVSGRAAMSNQALNEPRASKFAGQGRGRFNLTSLTTGKPGLPGIRPFNRHVAFPPEWKRRQNRLY